MVVDGGPRGIRNGSRDVETSYRRDEGFGTPLNCFGWVSFAGNRYVVATQKRSLEGIVDAFAGTRYVVASQR